jgi:multidrug efflux system membrane fusion protein
VQRGAAGTFVYVVRDDLTVAVTPVQLGPVQGEIAAVDSGVAAGAKVVVDGADRLRDGARVELATRDAPTPPAGDAGPRATRNGQEGAAPPRGAPKPRPKGGA